MRDDSNKNGHNHRHQKNNNNFLVKFEFFSKYDQNTKMIKIGKVKRKEPKEYRKFVNSS